MIKSVMFFANGNTAVFNDEGEQIPELQESWLLKFLSFIESNGHELGDAVITLPNARQAELFTTSEGKRNWRIK